MLGVLLLTNLRYGLHLSSSSVWFVDNFDVFVCVGHRDHGPKQQINRSDPCAQHVFVCFGVAFAM